MARLHRARVTAVGSEQDMYRMAYVMLENGDWLPEEDEGPTPTLEELLRRSGVLLDETRYAVDYQIFAENLMPEITVLERGDLG